MKILFDNGTPKPIAGCLAGHEVTYARRIGWHELENGELIRFNRPRKLGTTCFSAPTKISDTNRTYQAGKLH
jgi:hypothetical protein